MYLNREGREPLSDLFAGVVSADSYRQRYHGYRSHGWIQTALPGDDRDVEPPDPIPNSEVKRVIADGSMGFPHVRVGHCQALNPKTLQWITAGGFFVVPWKSRVRSLKRMFSRLTRLDWPDWRTAHPV